MNSSHNVIVGASIAGVSAALSMRRSGFEGAVTIVDGDSSEPYERPPLSKIVDAGVTLKNLHARATYADNQIDLRLGSAVDRLDLDTMTVALCDGTEMSASRILLATGVSARRIEVPGAGLDNILTLRDAVDASKLHARFVSAGPFVVIGGGFIGLEAAAVARGLGLDVTVVEAEPLPLLRPLGREVATLMTRMHSDRGVRIISGATALSFRGDKKVGSVVVSTGEEVPAATVIVGCGVVPNDKLAQDAGVYCNDGIVVDDVGRTSHRSVWAAGDVANQLHPRVGHRARIEHWDVAMRHGTAVGASMTGLAVSNKEIPYFWSDQYGSKLQMYGRARPSDRVIVRRDSSPERFLAFWIRDDYVAAVAGLNEPKSVRAGKKLVESYAVVPDEVLADPAVAVRDISRRAASRVVGASELGSPTDSFLL